MQQYTNHVALQQLCALYMEYYTDDGRDISGR
jgi:hypothetical protein